MKTTQVHLTHEAIQNDHTIVAFIVPKIEHFDRNNRGEVPLGPSAKFDVKEISYDNLVQELQGFEKKFGFSTIEMFSRYINEENPGSEIEEWINAFILYLGTSQIRRYSCP